MKRKILALLLAAALLFTVTASALSPSDFSGGALSGVTQDGDALLVTDTFNKVIWRIEGDTVSRFAGQIGVTGLDGEPIGKYEDGTLSTALFLEPWDIAPFLDGWAVSDAAANVIRYIDDSGVRTAAGSGKAGKADGTGKQAAFNRPTGLAADPDGTLYIADTANGAIRKLSQKGQVTTVLSGLIDPTGLCWADGALYVAETGRSRILRIKNGVTEVLTGDGAPADGSEYTGGYVDGPAAQAQFDHPQGVAVGDDGAVYIADTGNHAVRRLADGRVTTLARAGQTPEPPIQPRGMLLQGNTLVVTDLFAQTLMTLDTTPVHYQDVSGNAWYANAVAQATSRGLATGTGDGCFSPDAPVTRAMFVTMLSRLHQGTDGGEVIDGAAAFSDVPADGWYAAAVRWAADSRIAVGHGSSFRPTSGITREELAAMLYRYAAAADFDTSARADLNGFSDASQISAYAADAVSWAAAQGILNGAGDGTLAPRGAATRAQTVQMLIVFMDVLGI